VSMPGEPLPAGTPFDLPSSAIRRTADQSAFEVASARLNVTDPVVLELARYVHEMEINFWTNDGPAQATVIEEAYRSLQHRYGRDAVPPQCYVAFFDRVYQVMSDSRARALPLAAERLALDCGELVHTADKSRERIPEVPIVDVLSAVAAGRKVIFVDVRESDEFAEGHIPGALNIPIRAVGQQLREQLDGADYVVSYCVKDFRGFEMAKALANVGVRHSVIMRPYGIKGWATLGLPVTGARALSEEHAQQALAGCLSNVSACLAREGA
ncbi:MAG TPA: rhodanese-like domain-containing protein, partial [Povalibacter sp.]|nr:rhodanese-like domain-containing protein [Povalibacter sp.]